MGKCRYVCAHGMRRTCGHLCKYLFTAQALQMSVVCLFASVSLHMNNEFINFTLAHTHAHVASMLVTTGLSE